MDEMKEYKWIELPSKGECYPKKSYLRCGKIAVQSLIAKDENIIMSDKFIINNTVCKMLLRNKAKSEFDTDSLCTGDKEAVILWFIRDAYGDKIQLDNGEIFDLSTIKYKKFTLRGDKHGFFRYKAKNGDKVVFKYLSFINEEDVVKEKTEILLEKYGNKLSDNEMVRQFFKMILSEMIMSVNGNDDKDFINEWLETMDEKSYDRLEDHIINKLPGLDTRTTHNLTFDDGIFQLFTV